MGKPVSSILFFFVFLTLLSCRPGSEDTHLLGIADSLMSTRPDSAWAILRKIRDTRFVSRLERAEYALLLTQARYENNISLASDSLQGMAHTFLSKERTDSALYYCSKALKIAGEEKDSLWLSATLCDISRVYGQRKEIDKAIQFISKSIECAPSGADLSANFCQKGRLMNHIGLLDSAFYYLALSKNSPDLSTRAASYDELSELEKKRGDGDRAILYLDSFVLLHDSIQTFNRRAEIDRLMDNHVLELHKKKLTVEFRNRFVWLGSIFLVLLLVGIFILVLIDKRRKRKLAAWQNALEQDRKTEQQETTPIGFLLNKPDASGAIEEQRLNRCVDAFCELYEVSRLDAIEHSASQKEKMFMPEERDELYTAICQAFQDIIFDIQEQSGKLTCENKVFCILALLGYSNYTIHICMATNPGALKTRKSRLKSQMNEELFNRIFFSVTEQ